VIVTLTEEPSKSTFSEAIQRELDEKQSRLIALMHRNRWSAVLLSRHENLAWATAGRVEARVGLGSETAVCSLLITRDGQRYYIAPANEAPRLAAEEFAGLDYEPLLYPWAYPSADDLARRFGGVAIASDSWHPSFYHASFTSLRAPLLPGEVARFRAFATAVAESATRVLRTLQPGITEDEMAARISADLLAQHITPTVLLMAADERVLRYKHAVPRSGVLRNYGMLNLCARRWGLVISITRFIHFGPMPSELAANFEKSARINAELLHATREGVTSADLYAVAARGYAAAGVPDEITKHHQGGPAGYLERDWIARPAGAERVASAQAFAWNPSLQGAKAEDTALLRDGEIELLTATPSLPVIETELAGKVYRSAGVFLP
jgi:antitoxin VapB